MRSYNREDYASADEWLEDLNQDKFWLKRFSELQNLTPGDFAKWRDESIEMIKSGPRVYFLWKTPPHDVKSVVEEAWKMDKCSLSLLMTQTMGMLTIEWLEQHADDKTAQAEEAAFLDKLSLCFKNNDEASRFLTSIREMNNIDTVRLAKKYRDNDRCTDTSKKLWKLLYDAGLYKASYQNWINQMNKR